VLVVSPFINLLLKSEEILYSIDARTGLRLLSDICFFLKNIGERRNFLLLGAGAYESDSLSV
jgi:hypothetical protein